MVFTYLQMQFNRLTGGLVPPPRHYESAPPGGYNVLLIQAHPRKDSYSAYLARAVHESLHTAGHRVHALDLYTCSGGKPFNPVLTAAEHERYMKGTPPSPYPTPSPDISPLVQALRSADAIVFVYPTWWMGVPAILKGFFDRTFIPGVSFKLPGVDGAPETSNGALIPGLTNIKKVGAVTTYGAPRWMLAVVGDLGHGLIARSLLPLFAPDCTIQWQGLYSMDHTTAKSRADFVADVREAYLQFLPPPGEPSNEETATVAPAAAAA
jgi:putative NADPH-quinone reductase